MQLNKTKQYANGIKDQNTIQLTLEIHNLIIQVKSEQRFLKVPEESLQQNGRVVGVIAELKRLAPVAGALQLLDHRHVG